MYHSSSLYHLYLVESVGGRAGFGIATNIKDRNKHYASHSGDIVKFPVIYGGLRSHAKALEKTIKSQYADNLWIVDDWKTEWLIKDVKIKQLKKYVDELIEERHYKLEVVATNYDFTNG